MTLMTLALPFRVLFRVLGTRFRVFRPFETFVKTYFFRRREDGDFDLVLEGRRVSEVGNWSLTPAPSTIH